MMRPVDLVAAAIPRLRHAATLFGSIDVVVSLNSHRAGDLFSKHWPRTFPSAGSLAPVGPAWLDGEDVTIIRSERSHPPSPRSALPLPITKRSRRFDGRARWLRQAMSRLATSRSPRPRLLNMTTTFWPCATMPTWTCTSSTHQSDRNPGWPGRGGAGGHAYSRSSQTRLRRLAALLEQSVVCSMICPPDGHEFCPPTHP